jgi:hypothetical protein
MDDKKLQKLEKLLTLVDGDTVTAEEVAEVVQVMADAIKKLTERVDRLEAQK